MTGLKSEQDEKKTKSVVCSSGRAGPGRAGPGPALGEAVLWVADFDGTPVAGSYQTDEAQQVGECPGDVGGVVTTGKAPGTNLLTKLQLVYYISPHLIYVQTAVVRTQQ